MKPLEGAWIAVNRSAEDNKTVVAPGERISVEQACEPSPSTAPG